jgi:hypothetical protein
MIFLAENPADARRMGENAERRYERLFRAEQMVSRHIDLYYRLLTNPPRDQDSRLRSIASR